jgi:hypothetical protein
MVIQALARDGLSQAAAGSPYAAPRNRIVMPDSIRHPPFLAEPLVAEPDQAA